MSVCKLLERFTATVLFVLSVCLETEKLVLTCSGSHSSGLFGEGLCGGHLHLDECDLWLQVRVIGVKTVMPPAVFPSSQPAFSTCAFTFSEQTWRIRLLVGVCDSRPVCSSLHRHPLVQSTQFP
jgi:hypothetical protein